MSSKQRESFPFFRTFYEGMEGFSEKDRLIVYEAIFGYALDGIEPDLKKNLQAIFKMVRPILDKSRKMWENGCKGAEHGVKGGAPKGNKNASKQPQNNGKTTAKQPLINPKTTPNKNKNKNKNKNEEEKYISKEELQFIQKMNENYPNVMGMEKPLTYEEWCKLIELYGDKLPKEKLSEMENKPNLQSSYVSAYLTVRNWCNRISKQFNG